MRKDSPERIRYRTQILVCAGKKCSGKSDPEATKKYFKERIKELGLKAEVRACTCSCLDYCDDAPNIAIQPEGTLYKEARDEKDWDAIFRKHVLREG
jgi:(2Fe-2S) ferredoxin